MNTSDYEYRYRAVVAFVYGILIGWFGFVKPFRYYLELQSSSDLTMRYAGNFLPPLLFAFLSLAVFGLIHLDKEDALIRQKEILAMGFGGGLIVGNLCLGTMFGFGFSTIIVSALLGLTFSILCLSFPKDSSARKAICIIGLLCVMGAITGDLLLEYQVTKYSRRGWLGDYFTEQKYAYKDRKAILEWLPSYVGIGFSLLVFPIVWFVYSTAQKLSIRSYGLILSLMGIGYWYIPMSLTGVINKSFLSYPPVLRNQFRIACLFTHASKSWPTTHYEVQFEEEGEWMEGPLEPFFPVDIFGHRTRFNRIVLASKYKNKKGKIVGKNALRLKEIGIFIKEHWPDNFPKDPEIQRIRFTIANHPVGKKHCMALDNWSRPPLTEIPKKYKRDLGTYELSGGVQ